jgi:rubrerythrin
MELLKIYQYALQREIEGKKFFEQNASRLSHAAAVDVFIRLAKEEEKHIFYIQAEINKILIKQQPGEILEAEAPGTGFFAQRAQTEMIDQTTAEAMVPDLPVLRMAYLIERDFAEFYEQAASQVTGQEKETLELLAAWERVHEGIFKNMHDQAFAQYAEMPWGG